MRAFKIAAVLLILIIAGFIFYALVIYPRFWYRLTRHDSIAILKAARSRTELTNAVGYLGLFVPLTNDAWIAIRYRDVHGGGVQSCAIARDSGDEWFESDRHFCGTFMSWPIAKETIAAINEDPSLAPHGQMTNANGIFPSYNELIAIESATNLEAARRALISIGFKKLDR